MQETVKLQFGVVVVVSMGFGGVKWWSREFLKKRNGGGGGLVEWRGGNEMVLNVKEGGLAWVKKMKEQEQPQNFDDLWLFDDAMCLIFWEYMLVEILALFFYRSVRLSVFAD